MEKKSVSFLIYILLICVITLILHNFPLYQFVEQQLGWGGITLSVLLSLGALHTLLLSMLFTILVIISRVLTKVVFIILFHLNALAVYFIVSYNIILDKSMISNILNTNVAESSSYFSFTLVLYVVMLGTIPSVLLARTRIAYRSRIKVGLTGLSIAFLSALIIYVNTQSWFWIDKNAKVLGGMIMPWSYMVNLGLYYQDEYDKYKTPVLLPDFTISNTKKQVVVLVIGESARAQNFSLYGYAKNTNPELSQIQGLQHYNAQSCATYTTKSVECILSHTQKRDKFYEVLPTYLERGGVGVIWHANNWGHPPLHISSYFEASDLRKDCIQNCQYNEVLLSGLVEKINNASADKLLIVLHSNGSHGPEYYAKYPKEFEKFTPTCQSVEVQNCSQQELINAYDNTIVYTDHFLATLIKKLQQVNRAATLFYISDHGESLGENGMYLHGTPMMLAPKEQTTIPFIAWSNDANVSLPGSGATFSQHYIFHSILAVLGIHSPIYNPQLDIQRSQ